MSVVAAPAAGENEVRAARVLIAGLLAGAGVLATLFTYQVSWNSTTLDYPHLNAISRTLLVAAWVGVGLSMAWWGVEPGLAVLVAGAGFLFAVTGLNALDNALAYTVGRVLISASTVFIAYVSLRVVNDRLGTPLKRWFIGGLSAALVVLWALLLPISEKLPSAGQFSYCGDRCPPNALNVVDWPGPARALGALITASTALALLGLLAFLVDGARSASPRHRYAYAPLIYALGLWVAAYVLFTTTHTINWEAYDRLLRFVAAVGAVGTPVALFAARRRSQAFAAERVGTLVTSSGDASPEHVRDLVRDGLGDPHAVLAVRDELRECFVDADGQRVDVELGASRPGQVLVSRGGRVVAGLLYDPAPTDEAAARALAGAAYTLLHNAQLVDDLRAARARSASSAAVERRRLERDLHDGAQQRLLMLRLTLAEIEAGADPETARQLVAADEDLAAALEELRAIAHGIYPPVLRERGVADALRARALRGPADIQVIAGDVGRLEPSVELAVYYCALEAVQNAIRHGGQDRAITITLRREADELAFAVVDDGPGFDPLAANGSTGLTGMRDRISMVGGRLEIDSAPDRGTTVRGRVPLGA